MTRVLVAGRIHGDGRALLDRADVACDYVEEVSVDAYAPLLPTADALLIRTQPLTAEAVASAPRLRIVSRYGVGVDSIDVPALSRAGVALAIVGDVNSTSVAEHTMMLMLAAARRLTRADRSVRARDWDWRNRFEPRELGGRTLLIVGFGRIGSKVARLADAFGMTVRAYDPFVADGVIAAAGAAPMASLEAGLSGAEFVTLHAPPSETPMIGAAEIALTAPGAVLVNAARGRLVDEEALAAALTSGRLSAAGLDVFADEPPGADADWLAHDALVLTPHSAGLTEECASRMAVAAARNILDFFAGRLDRSLVVNAGDIGL